MAETQDNIGEDFTEEYRTVNLKGILEIGGWTPEDIQSLSGPQFDYYNDIFEMDVLISSENEETKPEFQEIDPSYGNAVMEQDDSDLSILYTLKKDIDKGEEPQMIITQKNTYYTEEYPFTRYTTKQINKVTLSPKKAIEETVVLLSKNGKLIKQVTGITTSEIENGEIVKQTWDHKEYDTKKHDEEMKLYYEEHFIINNGENKSIFQTVADYRRIGKNEIKDNVKSESQILSGTPFGGGQRVAIYTDEIPFMEFVSLRDVENYFEKCKQEDYKRVDKQYEHLKDYVKSKKEKSSYGEVSMGGGGIPEKPRLLMQISTCDLCEKN